MDEPLLLGPFSRTTHSRLAKACMATWPLVDALRTVAKPLAARRPTQQVPGAVHAEAVSLLAAARKALSRQPGMGHRLALGERCDWATLLCELEFAMTGFEAFRARYADWDDDLGEIVWRDESYLSFVRSKPESVSSDNDFDDF